MIVTVLAERLMEAKKELKKLVNKANRYGNTNITFKDVAVRMDERAIIEWDRSTKIIRVPVVDIEITGEAPSVGEYDFLARLDILDDGSKIVNTVPDKDGLMEERFRTSGCECEHCGKIRKRKELYVVKSLTDGTQLQVGRSCLKDFLGGIDPKEALKRFEFLKHIREFSAGAYAQWMAPVSTVLEATATCIRLWGWLPKSKADEHESPTSSDVWAVITDSPSQDQVKHKLRIVNSMTDEDRNVAAAALEWARNLEPKSDYESNLNILAQKEALTDPRHVGLMVSCVAAYQRHMEMLQRRKTEREKAMGSEHIGVKGERMKGLKVRQVQARVIGGIDYPECVLFKFMTEDGNALSWITGSGGTDAHNGDELLIDATVKDHTEWQGIKETKVNRVKVTKVLKVANG